MNSIEAIPLQDSEIMKPGHTDKKARPAQKRDAVLLTLKHYVGQPWTDPELIGLGDALIDYMEGKATGTMPLIKGFLTKHRISRKTIKKLRERSEYFDQAYILAEDIQEVKLLEHGLTNPPTMAIFILKTKFRYIENDPGRGGNTGRFTFNGFDDDDKTTIVLVPRRLVESDNDTSTITTKDQENGS